MFFSRKYTVLKANTRSEGEINKNKKGSLLLLLFWRFTIVMIDLFRDDSLSLLSISVVMKSL